MSDSDCSTLLRVLPAAAMPWPLHGVAASRAIERQALQDTPPHALMRRAGTAVAKLALAVAPHAERIWVAAGPGNNGGDGLEAARLLHAAGKAVEVSLLGDAQRLPADARDALQRAQEAGVPIRPDLPAQRGDQLAIDALLGLGASRPAEGAIAQAIAALNASAAPVLAVDLPSGLDVAHGQALGGWAVQAAHTLSLLTLKPGLFTAQGRDHAGTVWLCRLGQEAATPADAWLSASAQWRALAPRRRHAQHKGSFGDALVVGGAPGMSGAAWLAADAALVAGAGRVYIDPLAADEAAPAFAMPELMRRPGMAADVAMLARSAIVCGCGGGHAVRAVLPGVLQHSARLVLDADALNAMALDSALQAQLRERVQRGQPTLLTPHPLEAARLLGRDTASVQADRLGAAQALTQRFACTVLLKGSGSVVASPGETPWINSSGNALLATAGTGDVLAGWAGGLWAQCSEASALSIALGTAWLHGHAADLAARDRPALPLHASRLIDAMAAAANALG